MFIYIPIYKLVYGNISKLQALIVWYLEFAQAECCGREQQSFFSAVIKSHDYVSTNFEEESFELITHILRSASPTKRSFCW